MKVLILSSPDDVHTHLVVSHLTELKADSHFFRYEEFVTRCSISFQLGMKEDRFFVERESDSLDLRSFDSIWHRRPGRVLAGQFVEPWIGQMVESEGKAALEGMLRSLPCLWVNYPLNDIACMHKLWQLCLASRLGFTIPETLVTNNADTVKDFFHACEGKVIYKLIGEGSSFAIPSSETPAGIGTMPLRKEDLPFLDQVVHSPHLFQRSVIKAFDLRVTIVGHELFCITIDSQSGGSKLDWRNDYSVEMKPFDLPERLQDQCFALMRNLGLNYGAIDLILTDQGEYVFLEINCGGQFLWMEQKADLPISRAVARLLAQESEPLVQTGFSAIRTDFAGSTSVNDSVSR